MRIIDKNRDFYDYLQDSTDTLVFDRRNSFMLSKDYVCRSLGWYGHYDSDADFNLVLLQCGNMYWLFKFNFTERDGLSVKNYSIELLDKWHDYTTEIVPIKLSVISTKFNWLRQYRKNPDKNMVEAVKKNDYDIERNLGRNVDYTYDKKGRHEKVYDIPILRDTGIGSVVDPIEVFSSIEEYFSTVKTMSETTEAKGATNNDKIEMHGFDTKTSFRGKNK